MTFLSYIEYIEEIRHVDTSCAPFAQFQFVLKNTKYVHNKILLHASRGRKF